jgi:hypothetical protein
MRKIVWFAVVAAAAAGGTYLAMDYACRHPHSFLGHCTGKAAETEEFADFQVPDAPVPVECEAPGVPATPTVAQTSASEPGEPAPIVIPEDDGTKPTTAHAKAEAREEANLSTIDLEALELCPGTNTTEASEGKPVPRFMPYCAADDAAPRMPYAKEDEPEEKTDSDEDNAFLRFWKELLRQVVPAEETPKDKYLQSPPLSFPPMPNLQEDPNRHQQYPGLPFTGPPAGEQPAVYTSPSPPFPALGEKATPKPMTKPMRSGCEREGPCRGRPAVDTMEFRPSDARVNEFRIGPL